jgi:hypothetical protein
MSFVVLTLIYLNIETQHAKLMLQENFKNIYFFKLKKKNQMDDKHIM